MSFLTGIDTSSWQAGIGTVPADFRIVKTTGGTAYVNPAADAQFRGARAAGQRTGIYHFAHETGCAGSAAAEAAHFVAASAPYLDGRTLLALDFESDNQLDVGWALAWLNAVHDATGVRPLLYLNSTALRGADWSPVWNAGYGLWLAWYAVTTATHGYNDFLGRPAATTTPPLRWGPYAPAMWQFTSTAQLPGWSGSLDANVFYGDGAAWDAYCGAGTITPQGTITTPQEESMSQADVDAIYKFTTTLFEQYHAATRAAIINELKVWVQGQDNATGDREILETRAQVATVPSAVLNQTFTLSDGTKTNLAGLLDQLHTRALAPAPATVVNNAAPFDVDALVARLKAELPPAIRADIAAKLTKP
jgi:GH25 family lysozyme M1 (1,4-beta-N-acetylmuramidase)